MTCEHPQKKLLVEYKNNSLYRCQECNLIINQAAQKEGDAHSRYKEYYQATASERFYFGIESIVKLFRLLRAAKLAIKYPRIKNILDIGSGRGYMLYYLKKYLKYSLTVGTQISEPALNFSRNQLGLEIYGDDLLAINFIEQRFDLITIYHVLEHVQKPEEYISKIYNLLNKNGKLIIEVPNYNSWTRQLSSQYWLALDLNYHLTFFTPGSLKQLLKKYGFKINSVRTFSLEYSAYTSTQSLISLVTRSNHEFFQFIQNKKFKPIMIYHFLLFALLYPICLAFNLLLYFSNKGENLQIVAEKL